MDRTSPGTRAALVLVATLVLAGCSGTVGPDGTTTRTVTPAPVPVDDTPTARPAVSGLTPDGVTNASLLAASHRQALSNATFTERSVTTVREANETVRARRTLVIKRGPEAFHLFYEVEGGPRRAARSFQTVSAEVWSDGRVTVQSTTDGDGTVRHEQVSNTFYDDFVVPDASLYAQLLEEARLRRVDRRDAGGTTLYVFVADGLDPDPVFGLTEATRAGDASLRAVVGGDGVVHRVVVTYPAKYRGRPATVEHVFEYVDVGTTTAPRPPWYGNAIETGTPTADVRAEG